MRNLFLLAPATIALMLSPAVLAGEAKVTFENIEDYTDFRPANGIEERFQERKKEQFTEIFNELSEQLPEGQVLSVTIKDIDLSGRLEPTFGQTTAAYARVVRSIDFPTMEFDYALTDSAGQVLEEGSAKIKDMAFDLDQAKSLKVRRQALYFEEQMLEDWFNKTFSKRLAAN
ncbi:DUF3016 domain-containing protein [Idiomarina seosinensis]|uniref:DUF3016 domain-containing protein n=1 Tax=Idiomarina seosinensis TaxID=281739 RepID=A0A432Z794_9GAMM|nr:DUF3016 domain-containing protein [Idiomarina seosinensis]RUO73771.1 DUF3016 domain-containing protein [Idiomarina seosinensis]